MKGSGRKYIAYSLLALLTVFIVPKELFHAFHFHVETQHAHYPFGESQFDKLHSHCYLLQLEAPLYIEPADLQLAFLGVIFFEFVSTAYRIDVIKRFQSPYFRGPPVLV